MKKLVFLMVCVILVSFFISPFIIGAAQRSLAERAPSMYTNSGTPFVHRLLISGCFVGLFITMAFSWWIISKKLKWNYWKGTSFILLQLGIVLLGIMLGHWRAMTLLSTIVQVAETSMRISSEFLALTIRKSFFFGILSQVPIFIYLIRRWRKNRVESLHST